MPRPVTPAVAHLPAPAAGLLPHRRPVRLIEQILAVDGRSGRAEARIRKNPLFAAPGGRLDAAAHLELIAQTFAAVKGWRERTLGIPPQTGYLVGADGLLVRGAPQIGDLVTVTMEETERIGSLVVVQGRSYRGDRLLARGSLKLWMAPPGNQTVEKSRIDADIPTHPMTPWDQAVEAATVQPLEWEAGQAITQSFCFPTTFGAFQGHFPGHPVLPAFAQVRLVVGMLATARQQPLALTGLDKAKFREPLHPGQTVKVHCRLKDPPGLLQASATLTRGDRPLSTFQATVQEMMPPSN